MEECGSAIVNSYQVRTQGREAKGNLYIVVGGVVVGGVKEVRREGGACRYGVFGVSHDQPTNLPSFYKLNEVVPYFNYSSH